MTRVLRDPFADLWGELNRFQDEFARYWTGGPKPAAGLPVNVWADEHNFYVEADLPDVDPAAVEVSVAEGNQLTIEGERKAPTADGAVWVRQERPFGSFTRVVTLPTVVDADKVEARYEHGVLRLTLPKSEAVKPRKISVKA